MVVRPPTGKPRALDADTVPLFCCPNVSNSLFQQQQEEDDVAEVQRMIQQAADELQLAAEKTVAGNNVS